MSYQRSSPLSQGVHTLDLSSIHKKSTSRKNDDDFIDGLLSARTPSSGGSSSSRGLTRSTSAKNLKQPSTSDVQRLTPTSTSLKTVDENEDHLVSMNSPYVQRYGKSASAKDGGGSSSASSKSKRPKIPSVPVAFTKGRKHRKTQILKSPGLHTPSTDRADPLSPSKSMYSPSSSETTHHRKKFRRRRKKAKDSKLPTRVPTVFTPVSSESDPLRSTLRSLLVVKEPDKAERDTMPRSAFSHMKSMSGGDESGLHMWSSLAWAGKKSGVTVLNHSSKVKPNRPSHPPIDLTVQLGHKMELLLHQVADGNISECSLSSDVEKRDTSTEGIASSTDHTLSSSSEERSERIVKKTTKRGRTLSDVNKGIVKVSLKKSVSASERDGGRVRQTKNRRKPPAETAASAREEYGPIPVFKKEKKTKRSRGLKKEKIVHGNESVLHGSSGQRELSPKRVSHRPPRVTKSVSASERDAIPSRTRFNTADGARKSAVSMTSPKDASKDTLRTSSEGEPLRLNHPVGSLRGTTVLREFTEAAASLQWVNLDHIEVDRHKIVFWLNVYHLCLVHALIYEGLPPDAGQSSAGPHKSQSGGRVSTRPRATSGAGAGFPLASADFFRNHAYIVGGVQLSLTEMEHGLLRARSKCGSASLGHHEAQGTYFKSKDQRQRLCPRTHFPMLTLVLSHGVPSSPPIRFYSLRDAGDSMLATAQEYLRSQISLRPHQRQLLLPKALWWYFKDWDDELTEAVVAVLSVLEKDAVAIIQSLVAEEGPPRPVEVLFAQANWKFQPPSCVVVGTTCGVYADFLQWKLQDIG